MTLAQVTLDDKYGLDAGRVWISGTQALVRLLLLQRARDAAAGLDTAGYVTGYRGSPLGGLDQQLWRAKPWLEAAQLRFEPGVNEDLAATAVWGTQQVGLLPGARHDGVFAMWYGKGPGVDRSGDAIEHGNRAGTAPKGGVLLVFGDDHAGKSSTLAYQSEPALAANGVPVLYPGDVQEYLDLGLHGYAMSRFSGLWVGFKCVNETVEATATVEIDPARVRIRLPEDAALPPEGVHTRIAFDPSGDDRRLHRWKLPLAQAYVRANGLDRVALGGPVRRFGIVAAGKSFLDVCAALQILGISGHRACELGIAVYKPAMIWPLEPEGLAAFARGLEELFFVEEKQAFMETQAGRLLFNLPAGERPRLTGKSDESGALLLASDGVLEPLEIARVLAARLARAGLADAALRERLAALEARQESHAHRTIVAAPRLPYFCSGCPHNSSTRVPEGSLAMAGIGCHTMAVGMQRQTLPPTHMGGEGLMWAGMAPFTHLRHVFQNLGDGTYFHSGLLAVRAAVASGANITYKLLVNDAVAMTGGQPVEGHLSIAEITHQLAAERVRRIAVVSDEPRKYGRRPGFAAGVTVHHRRELERLQRELREWPGVSAIVYDQTCAAEKRRRRKRGLLRDPARRVFINERVCEGCGDCSVQSNCVSIAPLETPLGRKRRIDQSSCNKDYSCLGGFCPAFVVVEGVRPRRPAQTEVPPGLVAALPEPARTTIETSHDVLITGIGGTGVVTIGAVLGMAAHLEGLAAGVFDMTGLAQKGGAVLSHLRIARERGTATAPRIGFEEADLVLGCDLLVTAGREAQQTIQPGHTRGVLNASLAPTAAFQLDPDIDFHGAEALRGLQELFGAAQSEAFEASASALALLGDTLGTNMMIVGYALQKGLLPLGPEAIERALELNEVAVDFNRRALLWGRIAAAFPERFREILRGLGSDAAEAIAGSPPDAPDAPKTLRAAFLEHYQNRALAARYLGLVARAEDAERERAPGRTGLGEAVARGYFRLLARKDEYEVARLYTDGAFHAALAREFEGTPTLRLLLAPPLLARRDPSTGRPRKLELGAWIFPVLRGLAKLKFLRDGLFDPFGHTRERRRDRALIDEYERLIGEILAGLDARSHATAVQLAAWPEQLRGFGPVREQQLERAIRERERLLAELRTTPEAARCPCG